MAGAAIRVVIGFVIVPATPRPAPNLATFGVGLILGSTTSSSSSRSSSMIIHRAAATIELRVALVEVIV